MAESGSEEKTEAPTQKRRDDARKEGQVAFSKEVSSAALLGGYLLLFWLGAESFLKVWREILTFSLGGLHEFGELDASLTSRLFDEVLSKAALIVIPFFFSAVVIGVFSSVIQVGFKFTVKPLEPKLNKLSPLKGIGRMFSKQAFSELLKSLFKMGVIGYIGYYTFMENLETMKSLIAHDPRILLAESMTLIGIFALRLFMAMVLMAMFDYMFQKWDLEQKLKMSKQELKDELKQSEGDPQIKARIRQVQQELSKARMMQEVPKADVVVTNPTHFAVALQYDREVMAAPKIIAKGADFIALRIMDIARENNVIVYESPPVARGLFFQAEVGDQVPEEFYRAMAEILAFVYRVKKKR